MTVEAVNDNWALPRTRAAAKAAGSSQYFTGKPCVNGHVERRNTNAGGCLACYRMRHEKRRREQPEKIKEQRKRHRAKNIDAIREKERIRSLQRYAENPEARREYNRQWRQRHQEQERERGREKYRRAIEENPDAYWAAARIRDERRRSTPRGKLDNSISAGVHRGLRKGGKNGRSTFAILGYTLDELMAHLEKQFTEGMSWDNYGDWHIDHIIPVSAFNYETPDDFDFKRCWALKNLQPMWAAENIRKHAKLDGPFQPSLAFAA